MACSAGDRVERRKGRLSRDRILKLRFSQNKLYSYFHVQVCPKKLKCFSSSLSQTHLRSSLVEDDFHVVNRSEFLKGEEREHHSSMAFSSTVIAAQDQPTKPLSLLPSFQLQLFFSPLIWASAFPGGGSSSSIQAITTTSLGS
jgi:hypothetical protein